jgi:hexokinase
VSVLSSKDLINHPQGWTEATRSVIVNSELSLFGENIVQNSEWDEILQGQIRSPCRQPLEYVCGGLYLGEIMRLITIDAIHQKRLFNGQMPLGLQDRFSFSLPLAAVLEEDTSPDLSGAGLEFSTQFPLPGDRYPSPSDLKYIREIVRATSRRAAAYIAVSVHAMHSFLRTSTSESDLPFQPLPLAVGITGSVITKYPNFARNCRRYLLEIVTATEANQDVSIFFNETKCPTVIGAALAACFARQ